MPPFQPKHQSRSPRDTPLPYGAFPGILIADRT